MYKRQVSNIGWDLAIVDEGGKTIGIARVNERVIVLKMESKLNWSDKKWQIEDRERKHDSIHLTDEQIYPKSRTGFKE